ncbi:MAG: SpoIIE family protein phosphatase [Cytophagales bacterium]|nr:SpoIIE family protein phosphatase [Bernardetiaceae bacterium]MDW8204925.1 SpoIIE family protein phosphatase [Cytophagales bacterium]
MSSIRYKLILFFLVVAILPLLITAFLEYWHISGTLRQRSFDQLTSVREIKRKRVEAFFEHKRREIGFFAQSSMVIEAMKEFKATFDAMRTVSVSAQQIAVLRKYYAEELIQRLPPSTQQNIVIDSLLPRTNVGLFLQAQYLTRIRSPFVSHEYHTVHEKYHGLMNQFLDTYGYYDIFLIDDQTGHIVYTVAKETDFATSLLGEIHATSNLGKLFRRVRHTGLKNQVLLCDYELYLPSYLAPAAFLAAPIFDGERKIGTLAFQVAIDRIDEVMTGNKAWIEEGLGESGETYIVGSDYRMRTNSRFIIEAPEEYLQKMSSYPIDSFAQQGISFYKTTVLFQPVITASVKRALNGQSGIDIITDYRGVKVLSAYTPLQIADVRWVLLSEINIQEAFAPVYNFAWRMALIIGLATLAIVLVALAIAYSLTHPIKMLVQGTEALSSGRLDARVQISQNDEIGLLAKSFNAMAASLQQQRQELLNKQAEIEQQKEELLAQTENLKRANDEINMQNEEIRQMMEEIEVQRDNILEKTAILEQQKQEMMAQAEHLQMLNQELQQQNHLLNEQKEEIERQAAALDLANQQISQMLATVREKQEQLERKNEQTIASINYAKRIQYALIPPENAIDAIIPENFVLFIPRDIVSGDFYWFAQKDNYTFLAVVDCTGHGVPGALMSVVAHNLLHKIVLFQHYQQPSDILREMHLGVRELLHQDTTDNRDGMEIALCTIDHHQQVLHFAGAGLPLCYVENGTLHVIKGERYSIGGSYHKHCPTQLNFTQHSLSLSQTPRTFYIYSDGFQDQFGGKDNSKYMSKRFRDLLHALSFMPMPMQRERLYQEFLNWKGDEEQTDDILIIGFRI